MSDSIKVAIKVRPLIKREKDENLPMQWEVQGNHIFSIDPESKRRGDYSHVFDHIFDVNTNNSDVYDTCVRPIVDAAVDGFNGTIFAYGQTSSGKTYTMMGTKEELGVVPLAVENMFDAIANTSGREFLLRVSYLEIYNEKVNDLLHEDRTDLKIKEDPRNGQVYVECKEEVTNCPQNVLSIMKKGDKKRRIGETNMNERSSRSHTIFRITIESRQADSDDADGAVQVSQLNLVDLAGSERARQTGATGDRFKEGRHINLSLSSLGLVIMQLSEAQEYINFRDSKLTRILQTSLGGNALTTIICAITPAALDETQCTLAFASRAKSVKNKPQLNEVMSDEALLKRYSKQIAKLSAELEKSKQTSQFAQVEEMQTKLQEKDRHIQLIEGRMELLKTRIVSGANSVENIDFKNKSRRRRTWGGPCIPGLLNHSLALPTIQETAATEYNPKELKKAQIKRRQSIIQTPVDDIVNEKFQTAVEDFELELIESERNWEMGRLSSDSVDLEDNYYISKRKSGGNHVKFHDDVSVFQFSYVDSYTGSPEKSELLTPPQRHEEQDSGTPKEVLRERISHLITEYNTLQEFTTLEKQLYATERVDVNNSDNMEALLNHMKKSVTDSEMMCLESNKKYSDLQDKYLELEFKYEASLLEHEVLKKQVEKLNGMEEKQKLLELEKNQLKADMETKQQRLKKLEEERNDYEFQMELLDSKHKTREKELETSLQIAWTDYTDTGDKEKLFNIVRLQCLVDKLTKEVDVLKTSSDVSKQLLDHQLLTENQSMLKKVEEYDTLLQSTKNENTKLMAELEELRKSLDHRPHLSHNIFSDQPDKILDSGQNETITNNNVCVSDQSSPKAIQEDLSSYQKTMLSRLDGKLGENETEQTTPKVSVSAIGLDDSKFKTEASTLETQCINKKEQQFEKLTEPFLNAKPDQINVAVPVDVQSSLNEFSSAELQIQITEKSAIILELEELLRTASENNNNVKAAFESLRAQYEEHKLEINNLKTRVADLLDTELKISTEYRDIASKLNDMTIDKEAVVDENMKLKLKISENSDQLKNNENLIDSLRIDMDQLKLKLEGKSSELMSIKAKFEELQQIRTQVESRPEEPTTGNNSMRISNLEKELETNRIEIEKYQSEVISLNDALSKKLDEILTLKSKLDNLDMKNEHLLLRSQSLYEEPNEKPAIIMDIQNRTETILPTPDRTENSIQSPIKNSDAFGIEFLNKSLNEDTETGGFDMTNLVTDTTQNCSNNTLPWTVNNHCSNNRSITINTKSCDNINNLLDSSAQIKEMQSSLIIDTGKENVDVLKEKIERLTIESESLREENALLKSQIEKLLLQIQELTIKNDLVDSNATRNIVETDLVKQDSKLRELQNDIHKLKDQIISMQSEKTLYEGEKCAMQKIINENNVVIQRVPKLEAEVKDLELVNREFERTILELRTNLNTKSLELESIGVHKYESEIKNLKSYVMNLEHFNKTIKDENEDLKNRLHDQSFNLENDLVDDLRRRISEQEKITDTLEEDKKNLTKYLANLSLEKSVEQNVTNKPDLLCESACGKVTQDTKECSSIFANTSYFDEMDVSLDQDSMLEEGTSNLSFSEDHKQLNDVEMLRKRILELEAINKDILSKFTAGEDEVFSNEIANKLHELMNMKTLLEDENARITTELQLKIHESDEIKNDVQALRLGIEKLQQTIHLLTTENMEMSSKLSIEKDQAREAEAEYQGQVQDLYQRISKITEEKVSLESELKICQEQLDTLRTNTPTGTEDEVRVKIERYQEKIDSLTTENIELSTNLIDKIEELDKIKESKALLYDHECSYRDEVQELQEKVEELNQENIDLSNNLMEKIEESDSLKHAYELLENKLAVSVRNQLSTSMNTSQNEIMDLRAQNSQLKSENIDLVAKVITLSTENTKFSENLLETMAALDNSRLCNDQTSASDKVLDKSHHPLRHSANFSAPDGSLMTDDSIQALKNKLEAYQLQINHLTRLNKKLSDLKLSSCPQCIHLKELNDSRRTLKLEVRSLNHKLQDLQKKFEQKCADTEVLRNKACEELNLSAMSDLMLNGSLSECMNVSFVEEKVQSLNNELGILKQSHEKLSSLYRNKCSEIEKLNEGNNMEESMTEAEPGRPVSKDNKTRIDRVQNDIDKLREEIQYLKKRNTTHSESLNKFMNEKSRLETEIDTLKATKVDLNTKLKNSEMQIEMAHEKISILESEVTDLNKLVESLRKIEREAQSDKLNFEVEIELLKTEKITHLEALEELKMSLKSEKENNSLLQKSLDIFLKEIEELKNKGDFVAETLKEKSHDHFEEFHLSKKIEESDKVKESANFNEAETIIKDLKCSLAKLSEENVLLLDQIESMRQSPLISSSKLEIEIETAKEYITKEIRSLKPGLELSTLATKTVEELLVDFLKIIMVKEQEIIKAIQDRFEREKQSLEDAKRQSVDAEKRVTTWAKELETDIEKLQADLSYQEKQNNKLKCEIERLENNLKESEYEKQLLKEKMEVLENDFTGLQAELAKQTKVDNKQGKEVNAMQERERLAVVSARNREIELQNSMKSLKDEHNQKVEELTFTLEHVKTKNLELKSSIEGLEANERQLKSIIDLKSMDLAKLQQRIVSLEAENMQMTETCNQLNQENSNKIQHIEEITNHLKIKCDKLSEYKTKLESIIPEYEILKEQIKERKQCAERYKNEYEDLKGITDKELNFIKDKLSDEQVKNSSLSDQLTDLNNKNKVLRCELQEMKIKCKELDSTNDKLVKKVRNSTSNSRVEAQIEDLKDQNAMLRKNVEGASNRITELQESKNLVTKDLISLQGKYEMMVEEKKELEKIVESSKAQLSLSNLQLSELLEKLQAQIQEKNKIALELEATKLTVSRKEKEFITAQQEIDRLRNVNKELNEELDDQAREIQDRGSTIENLRIQLYELQYNSKLTPNIVGTKLEEAKEKRQKTILISDTTEVEILIQQNKELHEKVETMNKTVDFLRKENTELKAKVIELEMKLESRSCSSSRSSSPLLENNRRKQRRSDLYNQSRPLEDASMMSSTLPANCRCISLAQQVRELELEIVSKNGKIATLEMQIQSENFPYQKKCKDLEENLWAFKNKNMILKEEVKRLQRAISSTSVSECEVCRRKQTNRRDQSTQCLPDHKIFLSGTSSGIVDDYAKINKLEKEKALMRDLCRSRTRQIKELQQQLSEYEALLSEKSRMEVTASIEESKKNISNENMKSTTLRDKTQLFAENTKRAMKENLSMNILGNASVVSTNGTRSIWSQYP